MKKIKFVAKSGYVWEEEIQEEYLNEIIRQKTVEHGDIDRVELMGEDGPEIIWET